MGQYDDFCPVVLSGLSWKIDFSFRGHGPTQSSSLSERPCCAHLSMINRAFCIQIQFSQTLLDGAAILLEDLEGG